MAQRKMRKTFVCDNSIIITIPIKGLKDLKEGQLLPENFYCVYKDHFKVLAIKGKPKPVGAAQATVGVFLFALGLVCKSHYFISLPSFLFLICGVASYAAGNYPNMHLTKMSFSLNIISLFWSLVASVLYKMSNNEHQLTPTKLMNGVQGLIMSLLAVESIIALYLIYWLSKAVCREDFNTLPTILLKDED
ncbi:unnamed protein product [Menidia menidia]|uniref:(Atlantic silverside) hypothetical protein n=1 Tax=Menidia menidia TaxID=238744 RepID=A0A8S4BKX7_9TELE|nr:unnamed protein product [Menidia menidia]